MTIDIVGTLEKVNFTPSTTEEEVIQNIKTLISTMIYTVPLDRKFGIIANALDEPMPVAMAKLSSDIIDAISRYEPRAKVTQISFDGDIDGKLIPRLRIEI